MFSNKLKCECLLMSSTQLVGLQFPTHQSSGSSVLWCQLKLDGIGNHPCTNTCKLRCFFPLIPLPVEVPFPFYWLSVLYRMWFQWDLGTEVGDFTSVTRTAVKHDPVVLCIVISLCGCFDEVRQIEHQMNWWTPLTNLMKLYFYIWLWISTIT